MTTGIRRYDESVAELTRQGLSTRQIAERLGVSHRTVTRARRHTGTSLGPAECRPRYTPEFLAKVDQHLTDGWSLVEIARTYGVGEQNIGKHFPGRGWTKEQASELAVMRKAENRLMRALDHQRRSVVRQAALAEAFSRPGDANGTGASQPPTSGGPNAHRASQRIAA